MLPSDQAPDEPSPTIPRGAPSTSETLKADVPYVPPLRQGPSIAGYEIIGLLGQGGMGQVWRARDLRLNRLVAIKVIPEGAAANPIQQARFHLEAESLASLKHPNIVQVYEYRIVNALSYLALELVEGGSLSSFLGGRAQEAKSAARLVRKLAAAIHVAHQRGIIHRDLKPGNVLLQTAPRKEPRGPDAPGATLDDCEPKITDFGLAKRLESADANTLTGAVLGTPSYMAPEQARGEPAGPLADVYALGGILYEALTTEPPFSGATTYETIRLVQDAEVKAPRRLRADVPRDLDIICLKCLEKEPARRYASAEALAEDLRRFLEMEPIHARPASLWERSIKWVRRRPAAAAILGIGLVALVAFVSLLTWSNHQLALAAEHSETSARKAKNAVDDLYVRVAEEWLADEPGQDPVRKDFLERAIAAYRHFATRLGDDPELRRDRALAHFRLGQMHRALEDFGQAETHYDQAIVLQEALRAEFPTVAQYADDLAASYNWRGDMKRERRTEPDAAEQDLLKALALQDATAKTSEASAGLALTENNLGLLYQETGKLKQARAYFDQSIARMEELRRKDAAPALREKLGRFHINRGVAAKEARDYKTAEADFRRALALLDRKESGRSKASLKRDLAVAHHDLANLYYVQARYDDARADVAPALDILKALVADFPNRLSFQKKLARAYNVLGSVELKKGRADAAAAAWRAAWALLEKLPAAARDAAVLDHDRAQVQANLGLLEAAGKRYAAARDWLALAVERQRHAWKASPDDVAIRESLSENARSLAEVCLLLDDHAAAATAARLLAEARGHGAQDDYFAACFLCRAAARARAKEAGAADGYLADAERCLLRARAGGRDVKRFAGDEGALLPLARRVDCAALLAQFTPPEPPEKK